MTDAERTSKRSRHRVHPPAGISQRDEAEADAGRDTHLLTVLSVSSGMVGACLTAIGLIGIVKSLNKIETVVDDLLAIGTLVFMVAAALSFVGMRTRVGRKWRHLVRVLDVIFCVGMLLVVVAAVLLTWVVI